MVMARVKAEFELDSELLQRAEDRAAATGTPRDRLVEDALRRVLEPSTLTALAAEVRARSNLTEEQATRLAYHELDAARAERRSAASS